ncbi:lys-63-specific deubiquitinase BRCC36-like isoform X1 [Schistocerca americana]|uniref:lys-63-specific deubiquitinase BRCC36-like n=1 Tax=Schistocerca cancellata TaxID=274614 RepID=UPI001F4F3239|nr:lys-63-specific deubiquitinase BRCC36-like isoform X1 [Schistocerca americana]XP_047108803.1 lys-63-specific deubiquitinase BRCC36-like isoform X1 [Schistocerca piceifrons]XP_049775295.1 lys-63-specific deubiquitinase BRCC36-like [Schistocerca cancellata]XP_049801187.1 lys-63-specific deubiquitinase BRCC36-like isoform X1 [Schistocerca nitens]XP_049853562.1 lys-63-specific deubiquitinase BRCC36-like isoform X1 [Schistocerca gregaria]XP_049950867.1 lys-63-specific deubiquitinase BRCC36-like 
MALTSVKMAADVYLVCLQHALSTEKEEVMGLLIGEIDSHKVAHISAVAMLRRSDKRRDRVEISPEQLSNASNLAEKLAGQLNQPMRVIGWYHSHPHITVWPSHVDVQTQSMYQVMDPGFVGVIISVFNEDKSSKEQKIQITCFQSVTQNPHGDSPQFRQLEVPLHIEPTVSLSTPNIQSMAVLPEILFQEEKDSYDKTTKIPHLNYIAQLNNRAVLTHALCRITEAVSGPLLTALEKRITANEKRCQELQREKEALLKLRSSNQ